MQIYQRIDDRLPFLPWALWRQVDDGFGIPELDLVAPPRRFFADMDRPPPITRGNVDKRRAECLSSLLDRCTSPPENASAETNRLLSKLFAWFLVCEDRQNRLEARAVQTLAHQASLVRYVLDAPHLRKVLVGDEVGLGKTIEVGLILKELLAHDPRLRICYFASARLVTNVCQEFERLDLDFRKWNSDVDADANLERDDCIVASIHRAAHEANFNRWLDTPAWDVLIVDECHHLSNYDPEGHSPRRQYALIEELAERQPVTGRLILMSGTPHQGHPDRFLNLLRLLADDRDQPSQGARRVIFRTKEDVLDWHGDPLFPSRLVNQPRVMEAPAAYYVWMRGIHHCYQSGVGGNDAQQRAGGWRSAQALQWAASSLHAGLGYLVRSAIRSEWLADNSSLHAALAAIRPYRLGPVDEPIPDLLPRIQRNMGRNRLDEEDTDEDRWQPDPYELAGLIEQGVELLNEHADDKWSFLYEELIAPANDDQVVLFAQPIETVCAVSRFLENCTGIAPSVIIGGQSQTDRDREVQRFWDGESRFLIGSRAAYEGFNLQCAHRLIHIDIPWNPMDLEQRVGRIHRFGSRHTIIVDTIVTRGSREADAYGTAFNRLAEIAGALAPDEERMQLLFGRIMNLVPPDELQAVLLTRAVDGLDHTERARIAAMVDEGLDTWHRFHDDYSDNQQAITTLEPGAADWADLSDFLQRYAKAEVVSGFSAEGFKHDENGNIVSTATPARVLRIVIDGNSLPVVCEDVAGRPVSDGKRNRASQIGLNQPAICKLLRQCAFPEQLAQLASLRLRLEQRQEVKQVFTVGFTSALFAVAVRLSIRREADNNVTEAGRRMVIWQLDSDITTPLDDEQAANLLRLLSGCSISRNPADLIPYQDVVNHWQQETLFELRRPNEDNRKAHIAHIIHPLALIHLTNC